MGGIKMLLGKKKEEPKEIPVPKPTMLAEKEIEQEEPQEQQQDNFDIEAERKLSKISYKGLVRQLMDIEQYLKKKSAVKDQAGNFLTENQLLEMADEVKIKIEFGKLKMQAMGISEKEIEELENESLAGSKKYEFVTTK